MILFQNNLFKVTSVSKFLFAGLSCLFLFQGTLDAQWQTSTYNLKGGWNAIYLHGDATHASPDVLFASGDALNIEELWRWNADPSQSQFTESPLIPSAGTPEWSIWKRGLPEQSNLLNMVGQTAYLVKCSGTAADTYSVQLTTRALPASSIWVRNGANLLGFPTRDNGLGYPSLSNYFSTFPVAIAANSKVYKYVGGELGPSNPVQVFSPISEPLDRNQAYWFEADVTGSFYAPLEIMINPTGGLDFGSSGSSIILRIRNRTSATVSVNLESIASAAAPSGATPIEGSVPLTLRTYNSVTLGWTESPVTGSVNQVIGPQETVDVNFGIDRAAMTGSTDALYASLLRITDEGNLMDLHLPVSAGVASLKGLWIGEASVSNVESKVASSSGSTTPRSFPLRVLLHVDETGNARLLSQVFMGTLVDEGNPTGFCTKEEGLKQDEKSNARRITVAHMPLDRVIDKSAAGSTGNVALGDTLVRTVSIPYTDPTNPFVHQYHPDHDNKDARPDGTSENLADGVESYSVERACSFEFTLSPPAGTTSLGWGSTVIGGNYTEVLSGLHKEDLSVSGTFILRRVSEIGSITIN